MSNNEAIRALNKHFSNEKNKIKSFGNPFWVNLFINVFSNGTIYEFDAPDLIAVKGDEVILIEHFEIDCFKGTSKGSENRIELGRIERALNNYPFDERQPLFQDTVKRDSSLADYIKNAERAFNKHKLKVEKYFQNAKEAGFIKASTKVQMAFWIDDVSPLGTTVFNHRREMQHVELLRCKPFVELFKKTTKIDYVLTTSVSSIWIAHKDSLDVYEKECFDYENMEFANMEVNIIGYEIEVDS